MGEERVGRMRSLRGHGFREGGGEEREGEEARVTGERSASRERPQRPLYFLCVICSNLGTTYMSISMSTL